MKFLYLLTAMLSEHGSVAMVTRYSQQQGKPQIAVASRNMRKNNLPIKQQCQRHMLLCFHGNKIFIATNTYHRLLLPQEMHALKIKILHLVP